MYEKPRPFFLRRDFSDENPDSYFFLFAPWLSVAVGGLAGSEPTFVHVECMCVMYTNVVSDGSQPAI